MFNLYDGMDVIVDSKIKMSGVSCFWADQIDEIEIPTAAGAFP
jgi:hypothetical protein